jgi:quercetin dioxygenase-like cupin family protein
MDTPLSEPGQVIDAWSAWTDSEAATVILRTKNMEVMRLHLNSGARIPTYEAHGEVTILCVQGRVEVIALGATHELNTGQLLYLLIREPFTLAGLEESSLLVTVIRAEAGELIGA